MTKICIYCGRERDEASPCRGCGAVRFERDGQHEQREVTRPTPADCLPTGEVVGSAFAMTHTISIESASISSEQWAPWIKPLGVNNVLPLSAKVEVLNPFAYRYSDGTLIEARLQESEYSVLERARMWIERLLWRWRR